MKDFRCDGCGAPVTGFQCEYCGGPTAQAYFEMLQEQKRLEKLRHDAENTVIPVHLSRLNEAEMKEIKRRMKQGAMIRI